MPMRFLLLVLLVSVVGCAGQKKKDSSGVSTVVEGPAKEQPTKTSEQEQYGPTKGIVDDGEVVDETIVQTAPEKSYTVDQLILKQELKICLVFGPGLARGFAHVGVLEAFSNAKIPIHCIVGTEMGAIVGGLYSSHQNMNKLQWQLFKLRKDLYLDFPMFSLNRKTISGEKLNKFLKSYLDNRDIRTFSPQFASVLMEPKRWNTMQVRQFNAANLLTASAALPELFEPWNVGSNTSLYSGMILEPLPLALAKSMGGNFFIGVNLLKDDFSLDNERMENILKYYAIARSITNKSSNEFDFMIEPDLSQYRFDDFEKRSELISVGRSQANYIIDLIAEKLKKNLGKEAAGSLTEANQ